MSKRGFTLIELLVVIAIIAILAAILFPVMVAVKSKADSTRCMNSAKQIASAVSAYADQFDGKYPLNRIDGDIKRGWKRQLWNTKFIKTRELYICPSNIAAKSKVPADKIDESEDFPVSYAYNGLILHEMFNAVSDPNAPDGISRPGTKMSEIVSPSKTIFILESRSKQADLGCWTMEWRYKKIATMGPFQIHTGKRINWIFCDLHVQSLTLPETCIPRNLWGSDTYATKSPSHEMSTQAYYTNMIPKMADEYK